MNAAPLVRAPCAAPTRKSPRTWVPPLCCPAGLACLLTGIPSDVSPSLTPIQRFVTALEGGGERPGGGGRTDSEHPPERVGHRSSPPIRFIGTCWSALDGQNAPPASHTPPLAPARTQASPAVRECPASTSSLAHWVIQCHHTLNTHNIGAPATDSSCSPHTMHRRGPARTRGYVTSGIHPRRSRGHRLSAHPFSAVNPSPINVHATTGPIPERWKSAPSSPRAPLRTLVHPDAWGV